MRKSGLTGDEAYILSKHGGTTGDLGPLKKEISLIKEDTTALQKRQNVLVGSETGNPVSCDDAYSAPLCGLTVYGRSTQDGTPTPDNPVPIVSAGDGGSVAVKVTGKNWMPPNLITGNFVECSVKKNTQITVVFKGDIVSQGGNILFIGENNEQMWFGIDKGSVRKDIVLEANATKFQYLLEDMASENVCMTWNASSPDYEPYREQLLTLPTPNGLPGIPVASGGNYTDQNGQQWICDEVDLERGVKVQRVKSVDISSLDKSFWVFRSDIDANVSATRYSNKAAIIDFRASTPAMSNILPAGVGNDVNTFRLVATPLYLYQFNLDSSKFPTVKSWVEYLEANTVLIIYAPATPIETPLTPAEIAAYKAITAYAPDTVVQASDGAGIKLDYQRDVNLVVKNLEDAIASMTTT